ncbi:hypothetical protein PXW98_11960 [Staphylococcus capitis]|uniref:hypothetical protein n=1 Tax=Staphylococcus TaxID=1279 RepID=UPI00266B8F57|nr:MULTISPECIES: hypothetical protein [Staphylococcus]MDO2944661.1 hypothetical protein [Staphylococcus epidermidis]MDS1000825.1 hypothetical protein [Staphylococcus capitis]
MNKLTTKQMKKVNGGDGIPGLIKSTISKSPWGYAAVVAWEEAPRIKKGYDETKNQDFY